MAIEAHGMFSEWIDMNLSNINVICGPKIAAQACTEWLQLKFHIWKVFLVMFLNSEVNGEPFQCWKYNIQSHPDFGISLIISLVSTNYGLCTVCRFTFVSIFKTKGF